MQKKLLKSQLKFCLKTIVIAFSGIGYAWSNGVFDIATNELTLNAVDVDSSVLKVRFTTQDIRIFTLVDVQPAGQVFGAHTTYDAASGIASIPSVSVKQASTRSYFEVKLRLIPNSNPLQFQLIEARPFTRLLTASRSSSIALTTDNRQLILANRSSNSVSIFEVRDAAGADRQSKLAEVTVGSEPRYVVISPNNDYAYVSNAASGTVSVIALTGSSQYSVVATIPVGSEPRGIAMTPNGTYVYVTNHTSQSISEISTSSWQVTNTIPVQGNPMAVAITNDGDSSDTDERVYVTDFFSRTINGKRDGFDDAKQGVVHYFNVRSSSVSSRNIAPLANSGFAADRSDFCTATATAGETLHSEIFCPDTGAGADNSAVIQGVYPNQFYSALVRNDKLYLPNVGAAPAPPVKFNVNVQALVNVLDTNTQNEITSAATNLNNLIKTETQPTSPSGSLDRLFGNEIVAIDSDPAGDNFLLVSRGGNYVLHAQSSGSGLTINAPNNVTRYQTGNIPSGVVMADDGTRAYTNNEVGYSFSVLDLQNKTVLNRDISSSTLPAPGTTEHRRLVGKLTFFTALGTPNNGVFSTPIRDIVPVDHRNKASDNGWSSCGSCHNDGLADGVTWIFPTGPRQTVPLDAFFAKGDANNQRISNWNAVRGSVTDFNNNSRNIQGGEGFADDPSVVFNHGPTQGVSDALDAMSEWVQIVRSPIMPEASDSTAFNNGADTFKTQCASCHGGVKWTKSQVVYPNNPTFDSNPLAGGSVLDNRITNAGPQIVSFEDNGTTLRFLEDVGSFDATDPFEIRGAGGAIGKGAVGGAGFNVPSLLGVGYHGFYFHDGSANTLDEVFSKHTLNGQSISAVLGTPQKITDLKTYLNAIDDDTITVPSETDDFLQ